MIIYVDVLFLLHIVIYAVILSLFQMLWRCDKKGVSFWLMVLLTSLIQTVHVVMQMSMDGTTWMWISGILWQEFLFIRCYQLKGWRQIASANAILVGCTILLGGVLLSVMQTSLGTWCMQAAGSWPFLFLVLGAAMAIRISLRWYQMRQQFSTCICPYKIHMFHQDIMGTGYLDTGNMLRDPITKNPVIVGDYRHFRESIPKSYQEILDGYFHREVLDYEELARRQITGIRLLSCSSVGAKERKLPMLTMDKISYQKDGNWIHRENVYIAFSGLPLSAKGEYDVLLHMDL